MSDNMYKWMCDLFPIPRSLTGPGVRKTLTYLKNILSGLQIHAVPTGYKAFDWEVPEEWTVGEAYIKDENGRKIVDFKNNTLHLMGYSIPVDDWFSLEELTTHLYSLPEQPEAIPYVTSYYKKRWGFCLSHRQRQSLLPGNYHVVIQSQLKNGVLNFGELVIPGETEKEILFSTYICHPSMANNELSGPVVATNLALWLQGINNRKHTYRFVFVPETLGSIVYLSYNIDQLQKHVVAGFNLTCLGDDRCYSYLPSRRGNTIADEAAMHVLKHMSPDFKRYTWLDRGSDERQYCSPGVDLPVVSIMRSKYGTYPEYHTSFDDLHLVSPEGLSGGFNAVRRAVEIIENNERPQVSTVCEPQLGRRGLYPDISIKGSADYAKTILNLISYCDGQHTLLEIADLINEPFWDVLPMVEKLKEHGLLTSFSEP